MPHSTQHKQNETNVKRINPTTESFEFQNQKGEKRFGLRAVPFIQSTSAVRDQETKNDKLIEEKRSQITTAQEKLADLRAQQANVAPQDKPAVPEPAKPKEGDVPVDPAKQQLENEIKDINTEAEEEVANIGEQFDTASVLLDESTKQIVESIKKTYEARIGLMKKSNTALLGSVTTSGFRSGRAKFLAQTQQGIFSEEESKGQLRVGLLEGQMLGLLADAKQAKTEGKRKLLNDKLNQMKKVSDDMKKEVRGLQKMALDKQREARLADRLELDKQKTEFQQGLDKSEEDAAFVAEGFEGLETDEERVDFLQGLADDFGTDIETVYSDMREFISDDKAAQAKLDNTESLILDRSRRTDIAEFRAETARVKAQSSKEKPLSVTDLTRLKEEFGIDVTIGSTMKDAEKIQAEKFAKDNADKSEEELKKEIEEKTSLTRAEIDALGFWATVARGAKKLFGGDKTKQTDDDFIDAL